MPTELTVVRRPVARLGPLAALKITLPSTSKTDNLSPFNDSTTGLLIGQVQNVDSSNKMSCMVFG